MVPRPAPVYRHINMDVPFGGIEGIRAATLMARPGIARAGTDPSSPASDNERNGESPARPPGDSIPAQAPSKRPGQSGGDRKKKLPGLY